MINTHVLYILTLLYTAMVLQGQKIVSAAGFIEEREYSADACSIGPTVLHIYDSLYGLNPSLNA
ncbi:MAG: hypothetical protein H6Q52_3182 [Deltaproteobacteria bacterium]|nr:hypothetical protein [Deltaproteobacteria bacterium]